jgi:hypothetical protein
MGAADNIFPFSRKVWNDDIIKPINFLCENPPGGCEEIDPLDEAEKDHIWKKQDVQDVYDKLMELCDLNEFDDLDTPQLNRKTIIEDILNGILSGFCDCELEFINLGSFTAARASVAVSEDKCCGIIEEHVGGTLFCSFKFTKEWLSQFPSWVTDEGEASRLTDMSQSSSDTSHELYVWRTNRRQELLLERELKGLRNELDSSEEALDNAQNALNSCTINCTDEQSAVNYWQGQVDELEEEINEKEQQRDAFKSIAEVALEAADTAATRNWSLLTGQQYAHSAVIDGEQKYATPFMSPTVDLVALSGYSNKTWGLGPWPFFGTVAYTDILRGGTREDGSNISRNRIASILYTPNGLPYGSFRKYISLGVPYEEWYIETDTSSYPPVCPPIDPDSQGLQSRKFSSFLEVGDVHDYFKIEGPGSRPVTYDDV